ncbi:MAG: N-(5'-phosphoribosyl)anthranilate isomerase [Pseudodonghicola sp.]|nr:N-(5'-phosphoribosyl)anthranilate isomerase [Pseudodonghicola sp.]
MTQLSPHFTPEKWLLQLFSSKAACAGGVIRRQTRDGERLIGRTQFEAELARRGFHAVENADQIVIFCNQQPVRVIR